VRYEDGLMRNLAFFPGYPILIDCFHLIFPNRTLCAFLAAWTPYLCAGPVLYRLLRLEYDHARCLRILRLVCLAPAAVFFFRQFMLASLPLELLDSARIDGSREFYTFNRIAMPIMKPAMATQGIFSFVGTWNSLFMPSILLTKDNVKTMPVMVAMLKGDIYKREHGAIYLGLTLTVLPLFIVYFALSKYIIAGVALGGVKG
jgi:ABC-type glycerol-3-phosphate transport system permease component